MRGKALEDDVAAAIAQVNNQDVVTLELANALDFFSLRVDLEIKPISIDIIEQLNALNVSISNLIFECPLSCKGCLLILHTAISAS